MPVFNFHQCYILYAVLKNKHLIIEALVTYHLFFFILNALYQNAFHVTPIFSLNL